LQAALPDVPDMQLVDDNAEHQVVFGYLQNHMMAFDIIFACQQMIGGAGLHPPGSFCSTHA
jgi:hypothetical protein